MLTAIAMLILGVFAFSVDFAYRLGLSKRGDQRQETRTSIFVDVAGISVCLGFILGVLAIRLADVQDEFARTVIGIVGAAVGFITMGIVGGEKAVARFFGVELQKPQ